MAPLPRALIALLLAAFTIAVFAPVAGHGFLWFDDDLYIVNNPAVRGGLTPEGIRWAFTTTHSANWHPLTWLSHMLDAELFGLDAGRHHLVGLAIHAASAGALFLALAAMTGAAWPSALVAALFAVHPLHVESVAWAAERKDLLAGLFFILAVGAHLRHARRPAPVRAAAVALLLALGLLAKPTPVTLPFALLLLDVWPLGRLRLGIPRLVLEKLPLLLLSAGSAAVTFLVQRQGGAVAGGGLTFGDRAANALISYAAYLGKTVRPAGLAFFYPFRENWTAGQAGGAALLLALLSAVAVALARKRPWLGVGWLWYLGTLVPMIGLIQVGGQAMADRYTYLPLIGVFVAAAWGLRDLVRPRPRAFRTAAALGAAAVLALSAAARRQLDVWRDDVALCRHALAHTRGNYVAITNLGHVLNRGGRYAEAAATLEEAVRMAPGEWRPLLGLAEAYARLARYPEAERALREALAIHPTEAPARNFLGLTLFWQERPAEAQVEFLAALRLDPDFADPANNLGVLALAGGRWGEAEGWFRRALAAREAYPEASRGLGAALLEQDRAAEALPHLREALRLKPDFAEAAADLHQALARLRGR